MLAHRSSRTACQSFPTSRQHTLSLCHPVTFFIPSPQSANSLDTCSHARKPRVNYCLASKSTVSNSLISVLKDELQVALEDYRQEEELLGEPPNDFELDRAPGKTTFLLAKQYKSEEILIEVDLDAQLVDEEDEEEDDVPSAMRPEAREGGMASTGDDDDIEEVLSLIFKVHITKGAQSLVFECETDGEYLTIQSLALEDLGEDGEEGEEDQEWDSEDSPYRGPPFSELDDTLQQAFKDYLEERGVSTELCEYMRLLARDKAKVEFQGWLKRIRDFVAQ